MESDLLRQILKGPRVAWYSEFVSELEQELACGAELVLATSDEDATQFAQRFNLSSDKTSSAPANLCSSSGRIPVPSNPRSFEKFGRGSESLFHAFYYKSLVPPSTTQTRYKECKEIHE